MEKYLLKFNIINEYGHFKSDEIILNGEEYKNIIDLSKKFFEHGGFEMECEDGSFIIFPPEIVKKSILRIERKIVEDEKI